VAHARQAAMLPKSRVRASNSPPEAGAADAPSPSKYSSCRIMEFVAMSSSRFSPLISNPGTEAKASFASCARIAFRRLTAPP